MSETKGKGLQRLIAVALVFVMVFAQCFCAADVYAEGDAVCKVTVVVKDKDTGEEIKNAEVIFTDYYRSGTEYPVVEGITRNEDGTYNVPYDSEYGDSYYRYYAVAPGYKDNRGKDYNGNLQGTKITVGGASMTASVILLEKLPASERLQGAISDAQAEIENYLNKDDYDNDQQAEIDEIIKKYQDRIDTEIEVGEETEETATAKIEALNKIVAAAKKELDAVNTSQENINEEYVDDITFVTARGEEQSLKREAYGKFSITLSRFTKGTFKVSGNDEDTNVNWNAKKGMFYQSAGNVVPFEIIDNTYVKGEFLGSKAIAPTVDLSQAAGTIKDCSVTYTKNGKTVTVTFDLTITNDAKDESMEALKDALAEALAGKAEAEKIAADALEALKAAEAERDAALAAKEEALAAKEEALEAKAEAEAERDAALTAKEEALAAKAEAEKARDEAVAAKKTAEKARDAAIKTSISGLSLTVKAGTKKAYLSWNRKSNADGYIIYRSTNKTSGFVKIKTIKSNSTVKYTNYNLKSNKTYYYKIRAYKGSVYGSYSTVKYVKTR
ncbi:MAG: fibronectin type III domain-containing protein [Eubacteriaceae bacterium]|nr:fibronectin type III domain-containing protein [Eubacteriaceae bacterium]